MDTFVSLVLFSSIVGICWCDCSPRQDLDSKNYVQPKNDNLDSSLYNLTSSFGKWPERVLRGSKNTVRASGRMNLVYTIGTLSPGSKPLAPEGNDITVEKMCIQTQNVKEIDVTFEGPIEPATKTARGIQGKGPGLMHDRKDVTDPTKWSKSCFTDGVFSKITLTLKPNDESSMLKAKALFIKGCPKSRA